MNSYLINPNCQTNGTNVISSPKSEVESKCGKNYFMMFGFIDVIKNKFNSIIDSKNVSGISKDSLLYELINVEKNI